MKKLKTNAALNVLQSRDAVVDAIASIGTLVRERTRIEAAMGDEIAAIREKFEAMAQPLGAQIAALSEGVQGWCEAHRAELTAGNKVKFVSLPSGEVKWRMTPPALSVKGTEAVLALLRDRQLDRFMRVKIEVNKEALLNEPDVARDIPGVTITQREEFVIEPFDAVLAEAV